MKKEIDHAIARQCFERLRHVHLQMIRGTLKDTEKTAVDILGPAIERLEGAFRWIEEWNSELLERTHNAERLAMRREDDDLAVMFDDGQEVKEIPLSGMYVCRAYDRMGCSEDRDGNPVNPNSCYVCGAMKEDHQ